MQPTGTPRGGAVAATAWALAAVAWGAAGTAALLGVASGEPLPVKALLMSVIWVLPGLVVTSARPRNPLGWLALAEALLFAVAALAAQWVRYSAATGGTGVAWAAWIADRFSALLAVGI